MDPQEKLEAMFCPRLDSTLVASIYHDMKDFKACISILSALAAAAPPTDTDATAKNNITTTNNNNNNNNNINNDSANHTDAGTSRNASKKSTTSNGKQKNSGSKNILIWSEEVADAASLASPAAGPPRPSGLYKQGQVLDSSRQPATSSTAQTATTTTTPQSGGTSATGQPGRFRAVRNPNYLKNHGIVEVPSAAFEESDGQYEEQVKEEEKDREKDQDQNGTSEQFSALQPSQGSSQEKKSKNRRQKKTGKTGQLASTSTPITATTAATAGLPQPDRTWKKDSSEARISDQLADLNVFDSQSMEEEQDAEYFDAEEEISTTDNSSQYGNGTRDRNGVKSEELEFLKSCFPDREHSDEYLIQVLEDSRRDLEAAVEIILSQMFLESEQVETSSSSSGSFHSSGSQVTTATTSSLDDAFYHGVQSPKKKSKAGVRKNGSAWGARYNQTWDNNNNDLLLKTLDHQDGFLIPESNEWATFEHQISILMDIFHTVPQKTIVSEYHANGAQLFKTVESLEKRLKRENHYGSAQGQGQQSRFDVSLAQLMEMFPDHSVTALKKMLVYNGGNVQDAMNAVLAADFAHAEQKDQPWQMVSSSSKRGNLIPFQADIRFGDKNHVQTPTSSGNRLKSLPSTSNPVPGGSRPFPNTLLENANTELYNDEDDPEWCRQHAQEMLQQRNELFRKAAQAYQTSKGKGAGMGGIAAYYADEGKKLDAQGKQWHMRAARAVVQQHRLENNDPNLVDLHGLTVAEAQTVVKEAVTQWFARATMQASRIAAKPLKIVCGVGSHSKNRIARLYPTILSLLMKDGWSCEAENGVILVKGVARLAPTSSRAKR
ncbi:hypothetical protein BC939DRAFT_502211 [Gamsiella multidivaricata]|uniref:uncharacterized protein n=1 Tax=Gamsiella multidivaricata TaxID=101098 RepID=UPI00221FE3E9|nr:uncharacterized protein BC939DRAFT_502211 [Gamsiella multidivaricata]KAG0367904.1 hypothetical protein BGZ54_003033 [Gamsiella multidivaricata]KAI7825267.1 hypothetical protein BC939DRAFT_502211 [Gamsiella multidivaricata]